LRLFELAVLAEPKTAEFIFIDTPLHRFLVDDHGAVYDLEKREVFVMSSDNILSILREYKKQNSGHYGIIELDIFGSTARGEDDENSDVDGVIRFRRPNLFDMAGIKFDLEDRLHKTVDIVSYRENMNHFLKQRIDREAIYV